MPLKDKHIVFNTNIRGIKQLISFEPVLEKIRSISEAEPYGTKILAKELLRLIGHANNEEIKYECDQLYKNIFEVLGNLSGGINVEHEEYIAFASPLLDDIVYSSSGFEKILSNPIDIYSSNDMDVVPLSVLINRIIVYLILERFYNIKGLDHQISLISIQNNIKQYFELQVDFRFTNVYCDGDLPKLNLAKMREAKFDSFDDLDEILNFIDIHKFRFEGLSLLRFVNKNKEYIVRDIQNTLKDINLHTKQQLFEKLVNIFKSIVNINDVTYSFIPVFEISGFPIMENEIFKKSILFSHYLEKDKKSNSTRIYEYIANPYIITYGIEKELNITDEDFITYIEQKSVESYLGIPLLHKDTLVGFIEFSSNQIKIEHNDALKMKPYLPYFEQLASDMVTYLKNQINNIILENYTAIQPAIQWRFNEVAVSHLSKKYQNSNNKLDKIIFNHVYPIYGAIDIKDSTRIRNISQKEGIGTFLNELEALILRFSNGTSDCVSCLQQHIQKVKTVLKDKTSDRNIVGLRKLLQHETPKLLNDIKRSVTHNEVLLAELNAFENNILDIQNLGTETFEQSLSLFTSMLKSEIDILNTQIQSLYPSYFETFRTDGIEYDAYIGQSITPTQAFDKRILNDIRELQLLSMIKIVQKSRALSLQAPIALKTTQLIFIHHEEITISFREDEKRFDVEGGYNIRYQIIKKRIDKALIKESKERLVQPDTIAIVYSQDYVLDEIKNVIGKIIESGSIDKKVDYFQLEDLQGISELRAIRLRVN